MMNRRGFLGILSGGLALSAAGVYVPKKTYSFIWNNPLAKPKYGQGNILPEPLASRLFWCFKNQAACITYSPELDNDVVYLQGVVIPWGPVEVMERQLREAKGEA